MGIFRHDLSRPDHAPEIVREDEPCVSVSLWIPCDSCRVAEAQVEVVTDAGSIFLCGHHHRGHHDSIVAAGHVIQARPCAGRCG
jgi:hypothetical protein